MQALTGIFAKILNLFKALFALLGSPGPAIGGFAE